MGKKKSRSKHKNSNRPQDSCDGEIEEPSSDIKEAQDLTHDSVVPKEECAASPISGQKACPEPCAATDTSGIEEEPKKDSEKMYPLSKAAPRVLVMENKQGSGDNSLSINESSMKADKNDAVLQNLPTSPVNPGKNVPLVTKDESIPQSVPENLNTKTPDISSGDPASAHALPANVKPIMSNVSPSAMELKLSLDHNNDPSSNMSPSVCSTTSEKETCSTTLPKNSGNIPQNTVQTGNVNSSVPAVAVPGDSKEGVKGSESEKVQSDTVSTIDMLECQIDPNAVKSSGDHIEVKNDETAKSRQGLMKKNPAKVNESGSLVTMSKNEKAEKIVSQITHDSKTGDQGKEEGNLASPVSSGNDSNDLQDNVSAKVDSQHNTNATDLTVAATSKVEGEKVEQLPSMTKNPENQKEKNEEGLMTAVSTKMKIEPMTPAERLTMTQAMPNQEDKSTATANKKNANLKKKNSKQKTEKSDSSAETKVKGPDSSIANTEIGKSLVEENRASGSSSILLEGSKDKVVIPEEKPAAVQPEVSKESIITAEKPKSTKLEVSLGNAIALDQCATTKQEPIEENLIPEDKPTASQEETPKENINPADKPAAPKLEDSKAKETPADKPTATKVEISEKNVILTNEPRAAQQDTSKKNIFPTEKPVEPEQHTSKENKIPADKDADTKRESLKDDVIQEGKSSGKKQESLKKNVKPTGKSAATKIESSKGNAAHGEKHAGKKQEAPKKNMNSEDKPAASNQETSKQEKVTPVDKTTPKKLEGLEESIASGTPAASQQEVSKEMAKSAETKQEASKENVVTADRPAASMQEGLKEAVIPADKPAETKQEVTNEKAVLKDIPAASSQGVTKEIRISTDQPAEKNLEASKENIIAQDKIVAKEKEPSKENVTQEDKPAAKRPETSKKNAVPVEKPGASKKETSKKNVVPVEKPGASKKETSEKVIPADKQESKKQETSKKTEIPGEKHTVTKPEVSQENLTPAEKPASKNHEASKEKDIQGENHTTQVDAPKENLIKEETPALEKQGESNGNVIPADKTSTAKPEASKGNVNPAGKPEATKEKVPVGEKPTATQLRTSKESLNKGENPSATKQEGSKENVILGEKTPAMQPLKDDAIKEGKPIEVKLEEPKENANQAEKLQEASNKVVQGEKPLAVAQETSPVNLVLVEKPSGKKQEASKGNVTPTEKPTATQSEEHATKHTAAKQVAPVENVIHAENPKHQEVPKKNATKSEKPAANKQEISQEKLIPAGKPGVKKAGEAKGNVISAEKRAATVTEEHAKTKKEASKEGIQAEKPAQKQQGVSNKTVQGENPLAKKQEQSQENSVAAEKPAGKKMGEFKGNVIPAEKPSATKPEDHATKQTTTKQEAPMENVIQAEKPAPKQQVAAKKNAMQGESKGKVVPAEKPTATKQGASKENVIPPVKPAETKQEASKKNVVPAEKPTATKQGASKENVSPPVKPAETKQEASKKNVDPKETPAAIKQEASQQNKTPLDKPAVLKQEVSKKNVIPAEKPATTKQETSKKNVSPAEKAVSKKEEASKKNVKPEERPAAAKQDASKERVILGEKPTATQQPGSKEIKAENAAGTKVGVASKENVIQGEKKDVPHKTDPGSKIPSTNSPQGKDQSNRESHLNEGVSTKCTQITPKTEMGPDTVKETQSGTKIKGAANDPSSASDKKKRKENKKQVIPSKTGEVQSPEDRKSIPVPEGEHVPASNEKTSTEAIQKTSALGDATSKGLEKLFMRNDDETFQARPIFMANACHVCKATHGGETRLKSCSACRLIAYCSKEHQRMHWKEHKPLCQQVQKRIKKSGLQDLYGDAHKITDAEEWRKYRCFHIVDIEKRMGRPLMPFEREMFLYPRVCTICHKSDPEKLKVCKGCHFINYCSAGHLPISHKVWCKDLKMLLQINQYQSKYGLLRPQVPSINLDSSNPFPKSMKDFFSVSLVNERNSPHFHMYECILSDVATCPQTICHTLNLLNGVNQSSIPKHLTIHLVGAENQFEVEPLSKWDAFLLNLLPHVEKLHLVFVGPELEPTSLDEVNDNGYETQEIKTFNSSKKLTAEFYYGQLYHDYVNASSFIRPDLICAFNCGIYRFTGYNNKDTWGPTIASMVKDTNIPILLTAYTEVEAPKDVARFKKQCNCKELISPMKNPFASMRPNLNFVSDDETPLIYKNQYLSVVKGCDK